MWLMKSSPAKMKNENRYRITTKQLIKSRQSKCAKATFSTKSLKQNKTKQKRNISNINLIVFQTVHLINIRIANEKIIMIITIKNKFIIHICLQTNHIFYTNF